MNIRAPPRDALSRSACRVSSAARPSSPRLTGRARPPRRAPPRPARPAAQAPGEPGPRRPVTGSRERERAGAPVEVDVEDPIVAHVEALEGRARAGRELDERVDGDVARGDRAPVVGGAENPADVAEEETQQIDEVRAGVEQAVGVVARRLHDLADGPGRELVAPAGHGGVAPPGVVDEEQRAGARADIDHPPRVPDRPGGRRLADDGPGAEPGTPPPAPPA